MHATNHYGVCMWYVCTHSSIFVVPSYGIVRHVVVKIQVTGEDKASHTLDKLKIYGDHRFRPLDSSHHFASMLIEAFLGFFIRTICTTTPKYMRHKPHLGKIFIFLNDVRWL
jgi:hypothetical protein